MSRPSENWLAWGGNPNIGGQKCWRHKDRYGDFRQMRYLEKSDSYRQKLEWWLPPLRDRGVREKWQEMRSYCEMETELLLGKMRMFWRPTVVMGAPQCE